MQNRVIDLKILKFVRVYSLGINLKELNNYEELSLRHKLWFPNPYLCNLMPWSAIFLLDNKNLSIKYQRFTPSLGWKDKSKRKSDFVAKTHFLCILFYFSVHWFIFSVFESVLCLSCPAFVLSCVCLVLRLSYPTFVLSYDCPILRLSYPTFVLSSVFLLSFVSSPKLVLFYICHVIWLSFSSLSCPTFVQPYVCPIFILSCTSFSVVIY